MIKLTKKIYFHTTLLLYVPCLFLGLYYFLISEMNVVEWFYSSKFIGLYTNSVFFLFIVRRVNVYKAVRIPMQLRLQDEKYRMFLIKSLFLNLIIYLLTVYLIFVLHLSSNDNFHLLIIYFGVVLLSQFFNECLILFVIYKNLSNFYLGILIFVNFITQFLIIENII